MYRPNLPHHQLETCNGDCFDDLCKNCRDYIKSSDDESTIDQPEVNPFNRSFNVYRQRSDNSYSTDGYSSGDETSDHELFDPATFELKRIRHQLLDQTESLEESFQAFSRALNRLDTRLIQLHRQNGHCSDLRSTFEDYLQSFQEETESAVNCNEWFLQLNVLEMMLDDFDDDPDSRLQDLNDRMERLYDFFDEERDQPLNGEALTMANLESRSNQLRFLRSQIAIAELELNRLSNRIEEQVQHQRDTIGEFVGVMSSIVQGVQSALVRNEVAEFDCFASLHFLQEFNKTLNQIQII